MPAEARGAYATRCRRFSPTRHAIDAASFVDDAAFALITFHADDAVSRCCGNTVEMRAQWSAE